MASTATKRNARADSWSTAVGRLERAEPGRPRVEALLGVVDGAVGGDPELARFRFSLLASLRGALSSEPVAEQLAGEPRIVVEGIGLPGFGGADIAREATVRGLARARILDEEMLSASAVSVLLGSRSSNSRQYANRLRLRSEIVGVPHHNQFLFPRFQFDEETATVWPAARQANVLLDASIDPWGAASWWVTPDGTIGGRAPKDLLGSEDDVLVALARDLAEAE